MLDGEFRSPSEHTELRDRLRSRTLPAEDVRRAVDIRISPPFGRGEWGRARILTTESADRARNQAHLRMPELPRSSAGPRLDAVFGRGYESARKKNGASSLLQMSRNPDFSQLNARTIKERR